MNWDWKYFVIFYLNQTQWMFKKKMKWKKTQCLYRIRIWCVGMIYQPWENEIGNMKQIYSNNQNSNQKNEENNSTCLRYDQIKWNFLYKHEYYVKNTNKNIFNSIHLKYPFSFSFFLFLRWNHENETCDKRRILCHSSLFIIRCYF